MIRLSKILFIALIAVNCTGKKTMDGQDYLSFLNSEKSGLVISKNINGILYTLKCMVPEQQCLSFNKNKINTNTDLVQFMNEYQDKLNFILLIRDTDGESKVRKVIFNKQSYGTLMGYANSELNQDISLETSKGISGCRIVHLESANSVQPVLRMAISFGGLECTNDEVTFVFNDNIFNNGPIRFHYDKDTFEDLPILKIESI